MTTKTSPLLFAIHESEVDLEIALESANHCPSFFSWKEVHHRALELADLAKMLSQQHVPELSSLTKIEPITTTLERIKKP